MLPALLAQQLPDTSASWAPVLLLIIIAMAFAGGNVVLSLILGPKNTGPAKETTYESGMVPIGDTRKRFNVRFYVVAMIFLVFDVEIVFFYPFATVFAPYMKSNAALGTTMLASMLVFVAILLLAYVYAWGKGVFKWD